MKWVELAGLVKFDFLGLKTLTVLARCIDLLKKRGVALDLESLPLDNRPTFDLLSRGDTVGVFQVEGAGVRDMLKKLRPDRFEDIIAVVSLYRPGPMENIPRYIAVKHGDERPDYLHPLLEPILKETFGIMIYQEQVMQIAQVLAGYSLGAADLLRRAMGKKIQSEMDAQRQQFVAGATERGVERPRAELIFDQMAKFAGYGFNKSHAAAYALVAYQTAYLKANHPVEFMAASMTLDLGNTDKLAHFRPELDRLEIKLLPPDINRSEVTFAVETDPENRQARGSLCAGRRQGRRLAGDGGHRRRARPQRSVPGSVRLRGAARHEKLQPAPVRKPRQGRRLRLSRPEPGAELRRRRIAAAPGEPRRGGPREPAGEPVRRHRRFGSGGFAARPSLPLVPDWPPRRKAAARIRGDRFLPLGAPARRVRPQSGARRHSALGRSARGARRECQHPVPARRDRGRPEGAHLGARQPLCVCPDVGQFRRVRDHGVFRDAGQSRPLLDSGQPRS